MRHMKAVFGILLAIALLSTSALPTRRLPAVSAISATINISQFQVAGSTAADEFVELHNVGLSNIDLNGYKLVYRSAAGTSDVSLLQWVTTEIIPAGGYYLIAAESGYDGAVAADAAFANGGTGRLSASGGGLAIRGPGGSVMDSVGYGNASNAFVEGAPAPAPGADISLARRTNGCADSDNNLEDFGLVSPSAPRNSSTPAFVCTSVLPPLVVSTTPIDGAVDVPLDANLSVTFSEPVTTQSGWFAISCTTGVHPAAASTSDQITFTLNPDTHFTAGDACTVTLDHTRITDLDGTADPLPADYIWRFVVLAAEDVCGAPYTPTYSIQGSGSSSPLVGQKVRTEGVVTGDFQGAAGLNGFALQDPSGDGDPFTSDGLFIYAPSAPEVAAGQRVRVRGTVAEYYGQTELSSVDLVMVCGQAQAIDPTQVALPLPAGETLEPLEGMLVRFTPSLTVDQNYLLGRFGQLTLSAPDRLYQPTNGNFPADTPEYNSRRSFVLDDGTAAQNPAPIPYLAADHTLRAGDILAPGLVGVLDQGSISTTPGVLGYRLQPLSVPGFTRVNPRTLAPDDVGGQIKVAGFNLENYFTTIDDPGHIYPQGSPYYYISSTDNNTPRGADSPLEFQRQQDKLVHAIAGIDADVLGLVELESWAGAEAAGRLVTALNTYLHGDVYAAVADPATGVGGDAIKVALIYKPARVTPVGPSLSDANPVFDRFPVAQTFRPVTGGEALTVVVNHFKSRGSCPDDPNDPNADHGQGCWNAKRIAQAQELLAFIGQLKRDSCAPDVLAVGDFNAYEREDPIRLLEDGGLMDLIAAFVPPATRYTYVFDGLAGAIDQALATPGLYTQVGGVSLWHINADEPAVLDYNTEFKPVDFYAADPYRSSDHDPVLVGLSLTATFSCRQYLPLVRK